MPFLLYWQQNFKSGIMMILVHLLFIGLLIFLSTRFLSNPQSKWIFLSGLTFKILAGLLVGAIYLLILKSGDTLGYYRHAIDLISRGNGLFLETLKSILFGELPLDEWQTRTDFFSRFISLFIWACGGDYWLASIYFSFFCFVNCWLLANTLATVYPSDKFIYYLALLFIPSVTFWTSGLLKDSLVFSSLCAVLAVFVRFQHNKKTNLLLILFGITSLIFLVKIKFFVAAILIACLLYVIFNHLFKHQKWIKYSAFILLTLGTVVLLKYLHPWMRLERLPLTIFEINTQISSNSNDDNLVSGLNLLPTYLSLFFHTPVALFTGLFRPLPFESMTFWSIYFKFENLLILLFTVLTFWNYKKMELTSWIKGMIFFIFILAIFISLTTPNFGTLIRYRSVYMPFYIILISIIPYRIYFQKPDRIV